MIELRDPVSSASHLFTAAWAVFATLVMCRLTASRPARLAPILIFGLSMVCLYLASGLFHGLYYDTPEEKRFYQQLDQTAVFLLIAGSNTPVIAILLDGAWRKWQLRAVWGLALVGIGCLWLLPKAPHSLTVCTYVFLGLASLPPVYHYSRAVGWRALNWVWLGGGLYILGAVCELARWPVIVPGWIAAHEVLHLTHSAASVALFLFVVRHVIPYQPAQLAPAACLAA